MAVYSFIYPPNIVTEDCCDNLPTQFCLPVLGPRGAKWKRKGASGLGMWAEELHLCQCRDDDEERDEGKIGMNQSGWLPCICQVLLSHFTPVAAGAVGVGATTSGFFVPVQPQTSWETLHKLIFSKPQFPHWEDESVGPGSVSFWILLNSLLCS